MQPVKRKETDPERPHEMNKNSELCDFFEQCVVSIESLLSKLKLITHIPPATNSYNKLENLKEIKVIQ